MTEYRTIQDGHFEWLQYKVVRMSGFWMFKKLRQSWHFIRSDYYDYFDEQWESWERQYGYSEGLRRYDRYINCSNTNIDMFIKKYPVIEAWLIERAITVKEKRRVAHNYHKQIALRRGAIRMFNKQ